ncbi:hypothetical protein B0H21DRAFT_826052 [Amylocystis lapponica]|nr:hypothetical protein B0H21DRAFT_826052 [Amylocystis lapponica]
MHTTWPTNNPPAIFNVPADRANDLLYVPDPDGKEREGSTLLPVIYPEDPVLPLVDQPGWVENLTHQIPINGGHALVRRFDEEKGVWGPWRDGIPVAESTMRCPIGPVLAYWVEYYVNDENDYHRELFMPFTGELLSNKGLGLPSARVEDYYLLRMQLNLVFIPITTRVTSLKSGDSDNVTIFYVGHALHTDSRCTEWHVRVLNGPYAGKVICSTQVYSFTEKNAQAIANTRKRESLFVPSEDARYDAIQLHEEHPDKIVLPDGMKWTVPLRRK